QRPCERARRAAEVEEAAADERAQHLRLTGTRQTGIAVRIIERRRLDQAGEQARLRGVEPSRGNAEVALARRLDPVGVFAEIGAVQVRAEDLSLRIPVLELPRDRGVLQLAPRVV